jgi:hypothetical protein
MLHHDKALISCRQKYGSRSFLSDVKVELSANIHIKVKLILSIRASLILLCGLLLMNSNVICSIGIPSERESKGLSLVKVCFSIERDIGEAIVVDGIIVWELEAILKVRIDGELV